MEPLHELAAAVQSQLPYLRIGAFVAPPYDYFDEELGEEVHIPERHIIRAADETRAIMCTLPTRAEVFHQGELVDALVRQCEYAFAH